MAALRSLVCVLVVVAGASCSSESLTPFIAWSDGNHLSPLASKQPSTLDDFVKGVTLDDLQIFIVFKATKLSFDDIAKFGGVYGEKHSALSSLQSNLQSAKSTLWTGMHGQLGSGLVSTLSFNYNLHPQRVLGVDDVSLDSDRKQLIEVVLPEGDNDETLFMEQDKVISQFMSAITTTNKRYVAFYTADHSSRELKPRLEVFETKRAAIFDADNDNNTVRVTRCAHVMGTNATKNRPCVMMCLTTPIYMTSRLHKGGIKTSNDTVEYERADNITFIDGSCVQDNSSTCDRATAPYFDVEAVFNESGRQPIRFFLRQGDGSSINNVTCNVTKGFWTMDLMKDDNVYTRHYSSQLGSKFEVPIGASYACGSNSHNNFRYEYLNEDNETITKTLTLGGIQAQVGGVFSDTSFASAYNCQSYFSYVSLMGVVSVLILLAVLYCSTVFMFQMKSPDRFDDPRGPTISVENLH